MALGTCWWFYTHFLSCWDFFSLTCLRAPAGVFTKWIPTAVNYFPPNSWARAPHYVTQRQCKITNIFTTCTHTTHIKIVPPIVVCNKKFIYFLLSSFPTFANNFIRKIKFCEKQLNDDDRSVPSLSKPNQSACSTANLRWFHELSVVSLSVENRHFGTRALCCCSLLLFCVLPWFSY